MLEYGFSVKHEGCWTEAVNDEFPDVTATILQSHAVSNNSSTVIEVPNIDEQTSENLVDWMNDHPVIRTSDLIKHRDETALISLQTDYSDSDTEPVGNVLREQSCYPLNRAEVRNGFEHCDFIMASKNQVRQTYDELREYGPVEVRSLTELNVDYQASDVAEISRVVNNLSPRQKQVLKRAIERGYYDVPQGCNVEDLAKKDSATMSTVAEHLRHAERKIFDAIEPLLQSNDG